MVANVEVGAELRGREMEFAAHRQVPDTDGEQYEQAPSHKGQRRGNPFAPPPGITPEPDPHQNRDRQDQRVLARQRQQPHEHAASQPAPRGHAIGWQREHGEQAGEEERHQG